MERTRGFQLLTGLEPFEMNLEPLSQAEWTQLADRHREKMLRWTKPFRERRRNNESHPVHDFLFVYYHYSSKKLETWHPGIGKLLKRASSRRDLFSDSEYSEIDGDKFLDLQKLSSKMRQRLNWTADLLNQTQARRPNFSCLGLHEWAMVYRGKEVRHERTTKLRLSQSEIDEIVESRSISCSHYDAFRFFAIDAKPLNKLQPTLDTRPNMEQPACIHANMDLYKWAYKSMPWVGSEIVSACFDLAISAREVDMRASPYDLSYLPDWQPIKIETAEGRSEYEQEQRRIAEAGSRLRSELISLIKKALNHQTVTVHET